MAGRDGKSLQNSTRKALKMKNLHKKYVQKMPKIPAKLAKMAKISQKRPKTLTKTRETTKNYHSCEKLAHAAQMLRPFFSISDGR